MTQKFQIGGAFSYGEHLNMTRQVDLGVIEASSKEEAYSIAKKAIEEHAAREPYATAVNYHFASPVKVKKVFNGTPHAINVVEGAVFNPAIRKHTGGKIVKSIPSNGMLNAIISSVKVDVMDNIPVFDKQFTGVDPIPQGYDIYIVSALYASAAKKAGMDMSKIYTVADPVYTEDGNSFLGCVGICLAF